MVYCIADQLNLTLLTLVRKEENLLEPLIRKEVDVLGMRYAISFENVDNIDFPIPTYREPIALIAGKRTGRAIDMWVYLSVFGIKPWAIFFTLLLLLALGLTIVKALCKEGMWGTEDSSLFLVYLYVIQLGSHTRAKMLATRLLTMVAAMLTFLIFVYYTTNITAEMTSGPPKIPVKTFEDVLYHGFKVITTSSTYSYCVLEAAKPGTAAQKVYQMHIKEGDGMKDSISEALEEVITDPRVAMQ